VSGRCHRCGTPTGEVERVGRRDACLRCGSDLHCCRNCQFFAPTYHNQCREPQAERQVDKERANFCDYFGLAGRTADAAPVQKDDARARLDALFRKRSG